MPKQTRTLSSPEDVVELLSRWAGLAVEVIVRGRDSDAWLARFAGTVETIDPSGHVNVNVGGPEAWVAAVPMNFVEAVLYDNGVVVVRHGDGETTIRTESGTLPGAA